MILRDGISELYFLLTGKTGVFSFMIKFSVTKIHFFSSFEAACDPEMGSREMIHVDICNQCFKDRKNVCGRILQVPLPFYYFSVVHIPSLFLVLHKLHSGHKTRLQTKLVLTSAIAVQLYCHK